MKVPMLRTILTLVMVPICTACAGDADTHAVAEVPHDALTIAHTIGGADATQPEYEFGRIGGLALLADGRIAVADRVNQEVRVYQPDGTHAFSFGRSGAGPREFSGPCCIAVDPRDRLWVRDGGNGRYSIFEIHPDSAEHVGQVRMAHGDVNRWVRTTFDRAGNIIDIGSRTDRTSGVTATYRMHLDSAGTVLSETSVHKVPDDSTDVRKVHREMTGGMATLYAYQPYGPSELVAHSPTGEFAHGLSSRYVIEWRAPDGSLIRTIVRDPARGPALSAAEDSAAGQELIRVAERLGVTAGQLGFRVPSHKPPLRALFFDTHGRLWVELHVTHGADRQAHVYGTDGTLERIVSWPAAITLTDGVIREDVVWGVGRDSLDVATVVRLHGLRAGTPD